MSLLREVLAKVLFGDLGQCAILLQLDNGFVDFLDQVIAALAERQVGGRSLLGLGGNLDVRIRLLLQVVERSKAIVL